MGLDWVRLSGILIFVGKKQYGVFMRGCSVLFVEIMVLALVGCHQIVNPSGQAYQKRMDEPSGPPISGSPSIEVDPCSGSAKCGTR
ncbi:hypothetical protein ACI2TD_09445 [Ralstonia nicotianae]